MNCKFQRGCTPQITHASLAASEVHRQRLLHKLNEKAEEVGNAERRMGRGTITMHWRVESGSDGGGRRWSTDSREDTSSLCLCFASKVCVVRWSGWSVT
jgi:hypothetical protein